MPRWFLIPFVVISVAGCKPAPAQLLSNDAKQASAFIDELDKDRDYRMSPRDAVDRKIAAEKIDKTVLLRGAVELLQVAAPEQMRKAVVFLGRLADPSAIAPLVKALDRADEESREDICYALQWLDAKGEPAESALVRLRHEDPSNDVRVSASIALARPKDPEAVTAFELAVRSTKRSWVRELCEDELEKQGKLQLPLPAEIYEEIDTKEYKSLKAYFRNNFRREVRIGDNLFFEVREIRPDGLPIMYCWYRMKVEPRKGSPREDGINLSKPT